MSDISNNAADFSRSLLDLADYTTESVEQIIRKSCIDLYKAIVEKTPVDTGRAKASWGLSTSHGDDIKDDPEGYTFNEMAGIINDNVRDFKFDIQDEEVVIYNNLEYISILESGKGSKQAPQGMVAISLAEFTSFFNEQIRGLEGIS